MKRKSLSDAECPIARSLDLVGDWWSILILREALFGYTRFDDFEKSLQIAPNMLTRRLKGLVEDGLLQKRQYCEKPPRHEYVLTEAGRDFQIVMRAFVAWGNRHLAKDGRRVTILNTETGQEAEPVMIDAISGRRLDDPVFVSAAGPMASPALRKRYARLRDDHD